MSLHSESGFKASEFLVAADGVRRERQKKKFMEKSLPTRTVYSLQGARGGGATRLMGNVLQVNEQMQMSEAEG